MLRSLALPVVFSLFLAGCHAPRTVYLRNVSGKALVIHRAPKESSSLLEGQPSPIPLEATGQRRTWLVRYPTEDRWTDADRDALARLLDESELEVDGTRFPMKGQFSISMYGGPVNELFVRIENPARAR